MRCNLTAKTVKEALFNLVRTADWSDTSQNHRSGKVTVNCDADDKQVLDFNREENR